MARKGLLVSDPTVSRMTRAQWLFEYQALHNKEEKDREYLIKMFKATLINVLGLNLKSATKNKDLTPAERFEADLNEYTPLVMLAGNHHLLSAHFKEIDRISGLGSDEDLTGQSKVDDIEYEEMSKAIMDDMEPIDVPIARMSVDEINRIADNKSLGVQQDAPPQFPLPIGSVIISEGKE